MTIKFITIIARLHIDAPFIPILNDLIASRHKETLQARICPATNHAAVQFLGRLFQRSTLDFGNITIKMVVTGSTRSTASRIRFIANDYFCATISSCNSCHQPTNTATNDEHITFFYFRIHFNHIFSPLTSHAKPSSSEANTAMDSADRSLLPGNPSHKHDNASIHLGSAPEAPVSVQLVQKRPSYKSEHISCNQYICLYQ